MFYKEIPGIKPIDEQFTLAADSPSGLRHRTGVDTGPVAGTPCTVFFPGEERELFRQQHLQPMNYEVHVHTGWRDVTYLGFGYDIDREFQYVPAEVVREHLELTREIQLLTAIVQGGQKQRPASPVQHLKSHAKTVRISALRLAAIDAMNPSERSEALLREI
ncbi:hypothetical protein [Serratia liquefaciens]|uniref:hypothetical protein n=1 Tax=Serratia liquefaciens TaxID=614 RepID=UPI00141C3AFC|nr:hypothetical protein [Serratia liquefaciens]CAB1225359.1 hypothetical protein SFB10_3965 [Serratia liquefaciens]CAI1994090.1 Uncharacterised protein [Serratia liquefaciens]